ncbi:hypothetical protein [Curtobacterium sp. TXMA1]|uniref:hypothetical protein n=1 Tax=Curtobacterium sp. TXMA1 TaxID=2876939 RepID=UPI001CCFAFC3|nr:hypothetical protein [Curtobacterium sp. TXMA1]UBQ01879.1 hypothetical protein LCG91_12500 [Curtobacterium sp. TXMA1]
MDERESGRLLGLHGVAPSYWTGGGGVGALAVHLTYEAGTDLRVRHFISATTSRDDAIDTKWNEVLADMHAEASKFHATTGWGDFDHQRTSGAHTSLAGSKKQQAMHHIETIAAILGI